MAGKLALIGRYLAGAVLIATAPAAAQLGLPQLKPPLGQIGHALAGDIDALRAATSTVDDLAHGRMDRLDQLVRRNPRTIAFDDLHQPARSGQLLLLDPDAAAIDVVRANGFAVSEPSRIAGLDLAYSEVDLPPGMRLAEGLRRLRRLLPGKDITADQLHFMSAEPAAAGPRQTLPKLPRGGTVGVIDGGIAPRRQLVIAHGFAGGAPLANAHATEIASLLVGAGAERLFSADVYGRDPAGGNALAIAQALGWMVSQHVAVVSISLVGPANPLLARAVAAARARGTIIVAAVGNDGAAAPPAYPASYPEAVAVTGVDGRGRVLIEAGRTLHLDYAAPGADLTAIGLGGVTRRLRGTSFAAPLVAARLAAWIDVSHNPAAALGALDHEAAVSRGLGSAYGRGLLCGECRSGL